jgi:hypothetical protein
MSVVLEEKALFSSLGSLLEDGHFLSFYFFLYIYIYIYREREREREREKRLVVHFHPITIPPLFTWTNNMRDSIESIVGP